MNQIIGIIMLVGVYFLARDVLKKVKPEDKSESIKIAKIRTTGATIMLAFLALLHLFTKETFCEYYPSFCDRFPSFCENFPYLCR